MKYTLTILLTIFLFSCNNSNEKNEVKEQEIKNTKFELFLIDFVKRNPKYKNNQSTIKETSKIFKKEIIEFFKNNDSVFYYHPLQLGKVSDDGKYGLFRIWGTDKIKQKGYSSDLQNEWYVDVLIRLSKTQSDTLVEKSYYRIIGKFNRYIKENDSEFNLNQSWTFDPVISENTIGYKNIHFNIGCLSINPIKIELIPGNEKNGEYFYTRIFDPNSEK